MSFKVLKSFDQNAYARATLQARGISYWPRRPKKGLRARLLRWPEIAVGDFRKSWDLLETVDLLCALELQGRKIVDMGAYASEVLCSLHLSGFTDLHGVDLNHRVREMPFGQHVHWSSGDMRSARFGKGTVSCITAISAIEHGYSPVPLLREISRLLCDGGVFVGSTEYWPEKIDTSSVEMFGMSWMIFSSQDIEEFFALARTFDLFPVGEMDLSADEMCVQCAGRSYTFGWFALRKEGHLR